MDVQIGMEFKLGLENANSIDISRFKRYFNIDRNVYIGIFDPKRSGAKGFHEGIFDDGFGGFSTLRKRNLRNMAHKRRPEMDPRGFDGDAFTGDA